ncbi:MAG: type IV toxin-antitoxin system AbiEi family antitoxin [Rhodanobacteraceae bacterium]
MDMHEQDRDVDLLAAALTATRAHGLDWKALDHEPRVRDGDRPDARLRLHRGGQEFVYHVEIKRQLRPALLGVVLAQLRRLPDPAMLVTDYVTPPLAERLRDEGVQFIDAAGNAYLDKPPVLIWVKGQRPPDMPKAGDMRGRAFQATGLQVLFALLCKPELVDRPYREIAALAGVAHGTVGWVMPELPRLGFAGTLKGKRRLLNGPKLLQQWVEAYARTLRPKLVLERWRADSLDWTAKADPARYGLLLAGEPAARRLTRHLRPGTATFYGAKANRQLLIDQRLRPDPDGNVEILRRFWAFDGETTGQVPDLLVYADLLAIGDARCLEAAREMHDGIVARFE